LVDEKTIMTKHILMDTMCAALLWTGTLQAAPTAQQLCDNARIAAWAKYTSCVDAVLAKDARCSMLTTTCSAATLDEFRAFANCRHKYFRNWTSFQSRAVLAGSTCIGTRFMNNGATVTDNLTTLVWEQKDNVDGAENLSDPHDADNHYPWSTTSNDEDGPAFTSFLGALNSGGGFAGANGWRLPTVAELQTILLDFSCVGAGGDPACRCGSNPCIDATFHSVNIQSGYWSATSYLPNRVYAWDVLIDDANVYLGTKNTAGGLLRAVRGGL
jgi:hypothetical protein